MRKLTLVAGLAVAALIPSMALAQTSCAQQSGNQAVGTLAGAGLGALLGSAIAGRGDHTTGAVIGGVGGAIIGSQVTRPGADCAHAYGYYDRNGQWHTNAVSRSDAQGYYDRDGNWVSGAPNGYYEGDRWVSASSDRDAAGYTDSHGRWVPASAGGYYDDNGTWVATVSGYYDRGRWVAGQTSGAYDNQGRWIRGARSGYTDANGRWVAYPQPGYYDRQGVWRAGSVNGYYDSRGDWVSRSTSVSFTSAGPTDRSRNLASREQRMEQRIRSARADGTLNSREARRDLRDLDSIRSSEADMRGRYGRLSSDQETYLQSRLDRLRDRLRASLNDNEG